MRLVIISDTHGRRDLLCRIVEKHLADADHFFFLGDGEQELASVQKQYSHVSFHAVSGNCDILSTAPANGIFEAEGHRVFYTHGHWLGVKSGLEPLKATARSNGCDICLYGHTHHALTAYADGLSIMCPGSPARPNSSPAGYGIIDLTDAGIALNLVPMKKVP